MTIKRGVSLYSYQQSQFFKQMNWKDMIKEVHDNLKTDGIEIIDEAIIKIIHFLRRLLFLTGITKWQDII